MATGTDNPYGGLGPTMMGVLWLEMIIALILISMRLYVGLFVKKPLGWDFFWASVGLIFGIAGQSVLSASVAHGMGNHIWLLKPADISTAVLFTNISLSILLLGYGPGKWAVIAFLLRIQGTTHVKKGYFLHFLAWTNLIFNIMQSIIIWVQCDPPKKLWDNKLPGKCDLIHVDNDLGYLQGSWSAGTDLVLAVYPVIVFRNVQLPIKQKLGILCLTGAGVFACICGCFKTWNISRIEDVQDRTDELAILSLWAWTEYWIVLIAGSLPMLRPLFMTAATKVSSVTSNVTNRFSTSNAYSSGKGLDFIALSSQRSASGTNNWNQRRSRMEDISENSNANNEVLITKDVSVVPDVHERTQDQDDDAGHDDQCDFPLPAQCQSHFPKDQF